MKEVWVNCPDCGHTGPHRLWRDSTGETVVECACGALWFPIGVL